MPLAETNHQTQPGHSFMMLLAETNHQTQPNHPSRMPLAKDNHNTHSTFHNSVVFTIAQ